MRNDRCKWGNARGWHVRQTTDYTKATVGCKLGHTGEGKGGKPWSIPKQWRAGCQDELFVVKTPNLTVAFVVSWKLKTSGRFSKPCWQFKPAWLIQAKCPRSPFQFRFQFALPHLDFKNLQRTQSAPLWAQCGWRHQWCHWWRPMSLLVFWQAINRWRCLAGRQIRWSKLACQAGGETKLECVTNATHGGYNLHHTSTFAKFYCTMNATPAY